MIAPGTVAASTVPANVIANDVPTDARLPIGCVVAGQAVVAGQEGGAGRPRQWLTACGEAPAWTDTVWKVPAPRSSLA